MKDFVIEQRVEESIIQKYASILPKKLIEFWKEFGFGYLSNGYVKVINPDDYIDLLKRVYISPINKTTIPIFVTGLGDFVIWENNYITLVNLRRSESKVIESGFNFFFDDVQEEDFLEKDLENKNYPEIVNQLGALSFDECYAYFPLIGMGGAEKSENLKKVKIREYLSIVAQALGTTQ